MAFKDLQGQTSYHKNYIPIQSKEKLDQSTLDDLFNPHFNHIFVHLCLLMILRK